MCGTGAGATECTAGAATVGAKAGTGVAGNVGTARGSRWSNVAALGGALAACPVDPAGMTAGETTVG